MLKEIILPIVGVMLFIIVVGYITQQGDDLQLPSVVENQIAVKKDTVTIRDDIVVEVDIVDTENERAKGLSGKRSLDENEGMLFVFENEAKPVFWMKDMNFAIDIIWIDDGVIVGFEKNVPPPEEDLSDTELVRYTPDTVINQVLEVNAGFVEEHNIQEGDSVTLTKQ